MTKTLCDYPRVGARSTGPGHVVVRVPLPTAVQTSTDLAYCELDCNQTPFPLETCFPSSIMTKPNKFPRNPATLFLVAAEGPIPCKPDNLQDNIGRLHSPFSEQNLGISQPIVSGNCTRSRRAGEQRFDQFMVRDMLANLADGTWLDATHVLFQEGPIRCSNLRQPSWTEQASSGTRLDMALYVRTVYRTIDIVPSSTVERTSANQGANSEPGS
ncbi:hypothetical protein B0H66DRAFT_587290 [Apodospora peruviana]|uniref:Uncharacterized protein n=1 Tax=Apodospora peruviana TaxID=516989 RepID=A0AAE0IU62_9PEZI|nr:hypothetical protein B0H66DRAFT_587290 [Apodospora peruviana]